MNNHDNGVLPRTDWPFEATSDRDLVKQLSEVRQRIRSSEIEMTQIVREIDRRQQERPGWFNDMSPEEPHPSFEFLPMDEPDPRREGRLRRRIEVVFGSIVVIILLLTLAALAAMEMGLIQGW